MDWPIGHNVEMKCPKCGHEFAPDSLNLLNKEPHHGKKELLGWRAEYGIGITAIDAQHEGLFNLMNKLYLVQKEGYQPQGFILEVIKDLEKYINNHFSEEEALFMATDYPQKDLHKQQHVKFTTEFKELQEYYTTGALMPSMLLGFIHGWLKSHILGVDPGYAPYLKHKQG
jgi:hemerythrin-like metal-binding protein